MKKLAGSFNRASRPALVVGTLAAASLLAAAWGVPPAAATGTKAVGSVAAKAQATPAPAPSFAPAASGTIATILGQDLEVQGTSGQTTVELTAKTTITATVAVMVVMEETEAAGTSDQVTQAYLAASAACLSLALSIGSSLM